MSLFKILKKGARAVGGFATQGPIGALQGWKGAPRATPKLAPTRTPVMARQSFLPPVVAGAGRVVLPGAGRIAGTVAKRAGDIVTGATIGNLLPDFWSGDDKKKRRRMNYCNSKALMRATRRMNGYMKQHKKVEQALRRACPPSVRRKTTARKVC